MAIATVVVGGGVFVALNGCGWSNFETSADPMVRNEPDEPRELLLGKWEGKWESGGNFGDGLLRAVIRRDEKGAYVATFFARYMGGLTHTSKDVSLVVTDRKADRWEFKGQKDLGFLNGGVYTYTGYVTDGKFYAEYDSTMDAGTFTMEPYVPETTTAPAEEQ